VTLMRSLIVQCTNSASGNQMRAIVELAPDSRACKCRCAIPLANKSGVGRDPMLSASMLLGRFHRSVHGSLRSTVCARRSGECATHLSLQYYRNRSS
jgi:hypothetical protein